MRWYGCASADCSDSTNLGENTHSIARMRRLESAKDDSECEGEGEDEGDGEGEGEGKREWHISIGQPVTFSVSTMQQVSSASQRQSKQFVSTVTQSQAHGSLLLLVFLVTGGVGFLGRTRLVSAAEVWRRALTVGEIWVWVVRC